MVGRGKGDAVAAATKATQEARAPLTRERVLLTAMALADQRGLESVTMRRLARELGVEAMSLYHHVANKDDLLDGMVDRVFAEIDLPSDEHDWKTAMRQRALSARQVLARHRWAIGLMESRTAPGPALLRHHNAVLASLRKEGFSLPMAAQAFSALDSYIFGFALQEASLPRADPHETGEVAGAILEQLPADEYPHLAEMITEHVLRPGYDFREEYESGLDLILHALQRFRDGWYSPRVASSRG